MPERPGTGSDTEQRSRHVTRILEEDIGRTSGGRHPAEEILPLVYEELRALARARMSREAGAASLQPTMLVHEAYLRLIGERDPGWKGKGHFFGAAALAMRRILVDHARSKKRMKRGGGRERVDLEDVALPVHTPLESILIVDEAVRDLEARDPRKARIVNLRYFAGLTAEETARSLDVSLGTVEREWRFIKAWLQEKLEGE